MRYRVVNLSGRPVLGAGGCDQIPAQYLSDRYNCEIEEFKRKIQTPGYSQPGPNIVSTPTPQAPSYPGTSAPTGPSGPTGPAPVATEGGWSPGTMGPITTEPQPPVPNPNEVYPVIPKAEPEEPSGPEVNPPLTFMGPRGGKEEPPPLPPPPPYPPPLGPSVATPGGSGNEGVWGTLTICRVCPDGSYKVMNEMDARAAGCRYESDESKCAPKPPPPPPPLPPYPPPLGPSVPSEDRFIPGPRTTSTTSTSTQGAGPTGMACPPGQNLLPDGSCGTPTGGPSACPPGQFWDGRQCRGSVAPGFGGYGSVAFGGGGMTIPGGLEASGGMTSAVSLMGRRYPVMNLGR